MVIHGIIVHKIDKAVRERGQPNPEAVITPRKKELQSDNPIVIELVEYIWSAYRKGKTFGSFDADVDNHPVQTWLSDYLDTPEIDKFILLTLSIMDRLKINLVDSNLATGGHLLFIHLTENDRPWFMVVMIKDKKGFIFTEDLNLKDVIELELDKLHQAVRVDIEKWGGDAEKAYLTFIKTGSGDVANYFLRTFGCTDSLPSKQATKSVLLAVEAVCNEAGFSHIETRRIKDEVCNYMEENASIVSLSGIGLKVDGYLSEDCWGRFQELANSEEFRVSDTFEPNKQVISSHRRIKYDAPHWKLAIDKDALGFPGSDSEVIFDMEDNSLTIKQVPDELVSELRNILKPDD